ncbi:hypothetical protein [Streptomyces collinus]|uniref:hypothetical protein n=1 Tax=Streptomyces collinus TaxID=42684 RepID=UPI002942BC6A|nr:hypothetical protein [Streptomyces collinus]
MAAEVSGTFEYTITHVVSREGGPYQARTIALPNADAGRLERFEQGRNETRTTCDHCGARLLVALPSFADVRGERRRLGRWWKVCALATVLSGYGFLHVIRTATGTGHGPGIAFAVTVAATLFFAYRTLVSATALAWQRRARRHSGRGPGTRACPARLDLRAVGQGRLTGGGRSARLPSRHPPAQAVASPNWPRKRKRPPDAWKRYIAFVV